MKPERDNMIFHVLRSVRELSAEEIARVAKRRLRRDISPATITNLRRPVANGGTRYPQRYTLETIARVGGLKFALVPTDDHRAERDPDRSEART